LNVVFQKIRKFVSHILSPGFIAATATACLAIFFTIYNYHDYESPRSKADKSDMPVLKQVKSVPGRRPAKPVPASEELSDKEPLAQETGGAGVIPAKPMVSVIETEPGETSPDREKDYTHKEKTDPFVPLFKAEKPPAKTALEKRGKEAGEVKKGKGKKERKKRIPRTPLEKVDLSQLKLVAILRSESGNRALMQDASGKGYVVKKGTYIGIHGGKVAEIFEDRVIIEEEVKDASGKIVISRKELKLQKP